MLTAQAEAEKIRFIGEAEAASIEAVGKAEAEKMRLKAEAYQQYGDAAKTALVLEALPKVCDTHLHLYTAGFERNHPNFTFFTCTQSYQSYTLSWYGEECMKSVLSVK